MTDRIRKNLWLAALGMAVLAVFGFFYSGKERKSREPVSITDFKLNTVVRVTLYDSQNQEILQEAMELCDEYEKLFSRTLPESELYRLNHGELKGEDGRSEISEPLTDLISQGLFYSELSEGAFDISVEPLSSLWDFTSGEKKVPEEEAIRQALELVDYEKIHLEGTEIFWEEDGMGLELGAIAKGYIADRIKDFLLSQGVKSAIIDLGGNVLCIGSRPDGEPFRVGVQKPFADRNEMAASISIRDKSVVSSGIYERYFEKDGKLYHHILNPHTGYSYENNLLSVTIISEKSVDGDGLSTTCFALGLEKGLELVNRLPGVQAVFITRDGELHLSEGFEKEIPIEYAE